MNRILKAVTIIILFLTLMDFISRLSIPAIRPPMLANSEYGLLEIVTSNNNDDQKCSDRDGEIHCP